MKHLLSVFLLLLALAPSCGKIELTDEIPPDNPSEKPGGGEQTNQVKMVVDLAEIEDGTEVLVRGYIVGYVTGQSLKNTVFGVDGAVASNIVIADQPHETDYNRCAAVQLLNNSDERYDLNLADNPHLIGTCLLLWGVKQKYYYKPGIKPLYDYEFCEDNPDEPAPPTPPTNNYPILSNEAPIVFEGC